MECVHIKDGVIEAANGFYLVQKFIGYAGDERVCVLRNSFKQIMPSGDPLQVKLDKNDAKLVVSSRFNEVKVPIIESVTFPETEKLFPTDPVETTFMIDREFLLTVLKCFAKDERQVRFTVYEGEAIPIKLEVFEQGEDKPAGQALIMPIHDGRLKNKEQGEAKEDGNNKTY